MIRTRCPLWPRTFGPERWTVVYGGSSADVFMTDKLPRYLDWDNWAVHKCLSLGISQKNNHNVELRVMKSKNKTIYGMF